MLGNYSKLRPSMLSTHLLPMCCMISGKVRWLTTSLGSSNVWRQRGGSPWKSTITNWGKNNAKLTYFPVVFLYVLQFSRLLMLGLYQDVSHIHCCWSESESSWLLAFFAESGSGIFVPGSHSVSYTDPIALIYKYLSFKKIVLFLKYFCFVPAIRKTFFVFF